MAHQISVIPLSSLPKVREGDDLAGLILSSLAEEGLALRDGDVVVVAQKIVSKAEGRLVRLDDVEASDRAKDIGSITGKDARFVEVVLRESSSILRTADNVLIVEHLLGHIMANAGIDRSNIAAGEEAVLLLPKDPDGSARQLRDLLAGATGAEIGVIVSDSFGRAWRIGTLGVAIGIADIPAVIDRRGDPDLYGRPLQVTEIGFADAVASAAVLAMGEGDEGRPVAIVRGLEWRASTQRTIDMLRPAAKDMFR